MVFMGVTITDFDRFWETFRSRGAAKRSQFGCRGSRVFRSTETDDRLTLVFDWDRGDFERFLADPEVPEILQAAGLRGRPEITFWDAAGELPV